MAAPALRVARAEDAAAIAAIYAPYVIETNISFETEAPSAEEMAGRMEAILPHYPWIVCEIQGTIVGYAYAHAYGERAAYSWAAISSVYIAKQARHGGYGSILYAALEGLLAAQGIRSLYAHVTHPNPASDSFHLALGYEKHGYFAAIGYKFGKPVGVTHYAKALLPVCKNPPAPTPFGALKAETIETILAAASAAKAE